VPAGSVSPVESITLALDRWRVEVLRSELLDVLALVPDPRDPRGRRYRRGGLLAIAILATAAGMRGYAGFATWAATAPAEVLARLGIRFRRPSEKTLRSVLSRLDPADLDRRLGAYFTTVAAAEAVPAGGLLAVALDGKTLRAARRIGALTTHLVAVFAHRARLVPGQLAVADKSNEIPCMRELVRTFRKTRLLGTVDAMHTQTATAKLICGTLKSHYLMIVKSNQPKLLARIAALPWPQVPLAHSKHAQPAHERVETRTPKVLTTVRGIGFPHARQIIQITRDRVAVATGERSHEIIYAICSVAFEHAHPRVIAARLRDHCSIENAVHWVRDVTFDVDRSTVRTGTAPQVMASLRNTALNLHRLTGADNIAEACRVTAFSADRGLRLLKNPQTTRSQACQSTTP
jgi:predicted transposase YbfD/YdcC